MNRHTNFRTFVLPLIAFWFAQGSMAQTKTTYTASQNYTVPAGATHYLKVEAWGGGGRGGARTGTGNLSGGGGGGGAYAQSFLLLTEGTYAITVGNGSNSTAAGGDSSFGNLVIAKGGNSVGNSANGADGGLASASTGDITKSGGKGANGTTTAVVGGGGGGGSAPDGSYNAANGNGIAGGSTFGEGGNGGGGRSVLSGGNGSAGAEPGGGGGGNYRTNASGNTAGGSGGDGLVVITAYAPEINVTGNGNGIVSGATTTSTTNWTNFGSLAVTSGSLTRTFTIQNTAPAGQLLGIGTITVSGDAAADFVVTQAVTTSVNGGSTTTFTVKFDPFDAGDRIAVISFTNNDSNESPYTFTVSGQGTGPEMDVQGNSISITDGSTATSTSNNTNLGVQFITSSSTKVFTIRNTGTSNLTLTGTPRVAISGANASEFTITQPALSSLSAGASTTFSIMFTPSAAGVRTATISIANNDNNENPYNFNISGTGSPYKDSDNDGVTDEADIDDDNDGIIDTMEQSACTQSPIASSVKTPFLNETFGVGTSYSDIDENIPTASTTYGYVSSGDVNDGFYTVKNTAQITSWAADYWWQGDDHTVGDTNGKMAIFNAAVAAGTFYTTTLTGLTPNIPIEYSFWALNIDRSNAPGIATRNRPSIKVEFRRGSDNGLITTVLTGDLPPSQPLPSTINWKNFTSTFTTTDSSIKVIFYNNTAGGTGNDIALDDIVITQTYCDMDKDGNADLFDLDDDNDGIPDAVEAGFKAYTSNTSQMDMTDSATWRDVNANGMNDFIDPAIIGTSAYMAMIKDTDGDGIYDFMDLDSDNDSIFDIDEADIDTFSGYYNGDGDIDGDGRGDGTDTDLDGIQDTNDDLNGYGTTFKPYPVDSDGDGIPNYLDVRSFGNSFQYDIAGTINASLDANGDGKIDSTADTDKDGVPNILDGDDTAIGAPRDITGKKLLIDFDGRNDYAEGTNILTAGLQKSTLMGWIKVDASFANAAVLFGQDNFNISINASKQLIATVKGTATVATTASTDTQLVSNRWYHVAAVYDGAHATQKITLYLNGESKAFATGTGITALASSSYKFTIAKSASAMNSYFRGFIDEVRAFNSALTADQLRPMVCQELDIDTDGSIKGALLRKAFKGTTGTTDWTLLWSSLLAYYKMDVYKDDVIDDYKTNTVTDEGSATTLTRIYNVKYLKNQTAPMPFVTINSGSLNTGAVIDNATNFITGPTSTNFPGAIIQVKHDVSSTSNMLLTGLIIDSGKTLTVGNDTKMENSWYMELNGKIDLVGRSQLVQTVNSDLATSSSGSLKRDQQGTKNLYSYNYWSSPVSTISSSVNNGGYTVADVMKDGTSGTPQNILWTTGPNGSPTTPITLSRRWVYKFQNLSPVYANWSQIGEFGTLLAGQGYTLKGSGTASATQNYVFVGKPHNGTITSAIAANNINLSGNPYPSAIDSREFMKDNIASTHPEANPGATGSLTGSLYFWEQSSTNDTHVTAAYQGGYATINMVGRTKASGIMPGTGGLGDVSKVPGQYIPIGQAFFVEGSTTGGTIRFKNSQRGFQKEDGASNTIFRNSSKYETQANQNDNDPIVADTIKRVRLSLRASNNYSRQLLLGFMNDYASDAYDPGYDSTIFDDNPSDMYFVNQGNNLVIQGVGHFTTAGIYPLGIKAEASGNIKFSIDDTENIDASQDIFIYDALTAEYHSIRQQDFDIQLEAGTYNDRFSLRFSNGTLGVENPEATKGTDIFYANSNDMLHIVNRNREVAIETAAIFNILGQQVAHWKIEDKSAKDIALPVTQLSAGTYIVKVGTSKNSLASKIVIK